MRAIVVTYTNHVTVEVDLDNMNTLTQVDGVRFQGWAPVNGDPVSDEELAEAITVAEESVERMR